MSDHSGIEWTDATWNVVLGCDRVSAGCDHCYAIRTAHRMAANPSPAIAEAYEGLTERRDDRLDWTGRVNLVDARLALPLRWRRPRRIFVNAQSDLFHDEVSVEFIARVWAVMAATPRHTYQILTKRHARMRSLLADPGWPDQVDLALRELMMSGVITEAVCADAPRLQDGPLGNVHLGVSVEDQRWADLRIPALLKTPAAVRWISAEPLLGPVNLSRIPYRGDTDYVLDVLGERYGVGEPRTPFSFGLANLGGLDWVVVGGESGPGCRPMHPQWARDLRDQCAAAQVPYLFKQWGGWAPTGRRGLGDDGRTRIVGPVDADGFGEELALGDKRANGHQLDGRDHLEYPAPVLETHLGRAAPR